MSPLHDDQQRVKNQPMRTKLPKIISFEVSMLEPGQGKALYIFRTGKDSRYFLSSSVR